MGDKAGQSCTIFEIPLEWFSLEFFLLLTELEWNRNSSNVTFIHFEIIFKLRQTIPTLNPSNMFYERPVRPFNDKWRRASKVIHRLSDSIRFGWEYEEIKRKYCEFSVNSEIADSNLYKHYISNDWITCNYMQNWHSSVFSCRDRTIISCPNDTIHTESH